MTAQQYIRSLATEASQYQKVYKYVDYCGGMDMLRKSDIRFTSACALNDEYDCSSAVLNYNKYRELGISLGISKDVIERAIKREGEEIAHWGICSLCKTSDNKTLWSNYADGNGLCIELDVPKTLNALEKLGRKTPLLSVDYYDSIEGVVKRELGITSNNLFRYIMIRGLVASKSKINVTKGWDSEKEDEIRFVLFERVEADAPLYLNLPHECITGVYYDNLSFADLRVLHQLISRKYKLVPRKRSQMPIR